MEIGNLGNFKTLTRLIFFLPVVYQSKPRTAYVHVYDICLSSCLIGEHEFEIT